MKTNRNNFLIWLDIVEFLLPLAKETIGAHPPEVAIELREFLDNIETAIKIATTKYSDESKQKAYADQYQNGWSKVKI